MFARIAQPLANRFREAVSGDPSGTPEWARRMSEGDDEGLFGPESAVWQIHGSISTLIGGIRALLLQAAHPGALAGVLDHSRFDADPLGRLAGTTRWLVTTTFGATSVVAREAERVNVMHRPVTGQYRDRSGQRAAYAARDPRLLLWVHCAFTDAFLKAHLALGYPLARGADRYVSEWRRSAERLGLHGAPASVAELEREMDSFRANELAISDDTHRIVGQILHPPFAWPARVFYRVLANAAIATLDPRDRELLGLPPRGRAWVRAARLELRALSAVLGPQSPSERLARERIARLRHDGAGVSSNERSPAQS